MSNEKDPVHFPWAVPGERSAQRAGEADQAVLRALRSLRYGSLEVTVHDSRVVQIERREKIRFNGDSRTNPG
jgi:hypothetical protein